MNLHHCRKRPIIRNNEQPGKEADSNDFGNIPGEGNKSKTSNRQRCRSRNAEPLFLYRRVKQLWVIESVLCTIVFKRVRGIPRQDAFWHFPVPNAILQTDLLYLKIKIMEVICLQDLKPFMR